MAVEAQTFAEQIAVAERELGAAVERARLASDGVLTAQKALGTCGDDRQRPALQAKLDDALCAAASSDEGVAAARSRISSIRHDELDRRMPKHKTARRAALDDAIAGMERARAAVDRYNEVCALMQQLGIDVKTFIKPPFFENIEKLARTTREAIK